MADSPLEPIEPSTRGRLIIDDRALIRVAERSALEVPGVVRHAGTLDRVTGHDLPRVHAVVAAGRARLSVDVAVSWPHPVAATAAAIRAHVGDRLRAPTGVVADAVDVAIVHVTPPAPTAVRRVQ